MNVFWPGLFAVGVLYLVVFLVGVFASRGKPSNSSVEELLLAGRSLPLWVGLLTMTATWVGGGYINGTAEQTYSAGVLWGGQAGIGYAISLMVGGLFYAKTMRTHGYTTLVDPLESRYGRHLAAVLMAPAVLAELFWSAAILVALGTTFDTVLGLNDLRLAILGSAGVAIAYTVFGGLRAVAYTDVVQLFLILIGLVIALPYAVEAGGGVAAVAARFSPSFAGSHDAISWGDWTILLILGGIPWNVYFQRVLSAPSPEAARTLSIAAGFLCALMAIPPMIVGLSAAGIDWTAAAGADGAKALSENAALVLPFTLRYAVPTWIGVFGLGAVSAAVMSSVDSSILSASSLVVWNGYRRLVEPDASPERIAMLVKGLVVVLGTAATIIALTVSSISALWYLCGDVVYCVLFPQLTLALFDKKANRVGAAAGFLVSVFLRLGGGEAAIGLPAFLPYPVWDDGGFPFRTLAMISGLVAALVVSRLTQSFDPASPLDALEDPSR